MPLKVTGLFKYLFGALFVVIFLCVVLGLGFADNLGYHETVVSSRGVFEAIESFPNPISQFKDDFDKLSGIMQEYREFNNTSADGWTKLKAFLDWFGSAVSFYFVVFVFDPIRVVINIVAWVINLIPSIIGHPLWNGPLIG